MYKNESLIVSMVVLYLTMSLLLCSLLAYLYLLYKHRKIDDTNLVINGYNSLLWILATYMVLFLTVFDISFTSVIFSFLYCQSSSPYNLSLVCYDNNYILHLFFTIISLLIFILQTLFLNILFHDNNIFSKTPFANNNSKISFLK
jgi:heme/copper-type cytochrome/quinol oxidase subunit 2